MIENVVRARLSTSMLLLGVLSIGLFAESAAGLRWVAPAVYQSQRGGRG
jgi:hypothetical protein